MVDKVDLTPDATSPNHWAVSYDGHTGNGPSNYPIIGLAQNSGPHMIMFSLPPNGENSFSATDPIWVGTSKPNTHSTNSQISDKWVSTDGKTLIILDKNSVPGRLHYRLNINGPNGPLDPIVENGGGTTPPSPTSIFTGTSSALLLISVATLATVLFVAFQQSSIKQMVTGIRSWISKQ